MKTMKSLWFTAALASAVVGAASAQVSTINSVLTQPRLYNDDPTSNLTYTNNYPSSILISDQNVNNKPNSKAYANRDGWKFSNDNGATAYQFNNNDYFTASMTLTLTADGGTTSPRREAGFLFDTVGGQGYFIVNTDGHEVVSFGGPLSFYQFKGTGTPTFLGFNSGDTITLGMQYFIDPATLSRAMIFTANDLTQKTGLMSSPIEDFTNTENGIITGSTLGGYEQLPIDASNPNNGITAKFANISIVPYGAAPVPEASTSISLAFGALALGGLLLRKRRVAR